MIRKKYRRILSGVMAAVLLCSSGMVQGAEPDKDKPYVFFVAMNTSNEPKKLSECMFYSITINGDSGVQFGSGKEKKPFVTGDTELDAKFVKAADATGFVNLKGHRTVGGMRASLYNAMPIEGVERLVDFMKKFEENA